MSEMKKSLPTHYPTCYINGSRCNKENCIGYCYNSLHRGYLSVALMRQHKCVERNCRHFRKIESSGYWFHKEKTKEIFSQNKQHKKEEVKKTNTILSRFRELTADINDFCVTDIWKENEKYVIKCAALYFTDVSAQISAVRKEVDKNVDIFFINADAEKKKAIIEKYKGTDGKRRMEILA